MLPHKMKLDTNERQYSLVKCSHELTSVLCSGIITQFFPNLIKCSYLPVSTIFEVLPKTV